MQDVGDKMEGGGRRDFGAQAEEVARTVQSTSGHCVFPGGGPRLPSEHRRPRRSPWGGAMRERSEGRLQSKVCGRLARIKRIV